MSDSEDKNIAIFNALTNADNTVLVKAIFGGKLVNVIGLLDADNIYPMAIILDEELANMLVELPEEPEE